MDAKELKRRENKVRRQLAKEGYTLRKSRTQHTHAGDWGGYMIVDTFFNRIEAGERFDLDLEDVERFAAS